MKRTPYALTVLCLVTLPLLAAAQSSRPFAPVQGGFVANTPATLPYATDHILVKLTDDGMEQAAFPKDLPHGVTLPINALGLNSLDNLITQYSVSRIQRSFIDPAKRLSVDQAGVHRWYTLDLGPGVDVMKAVSAFAADKNVEEATVDWIAFPAAVPSDPLYPDHWGHNNTAQLLALDWGGTYEHIGPGTVGTPGFDANAQAGWDGSQGYGSSSVIIAIIDTGVDTSHPDLTLVAGYDYGSGDSNPDDNAPGGGHGTCCAGVCTENVNNGIGSAGIAANCRVMPLKVADNSGNMYFSAIVNAIYHAADNGANIISMSLGAAISSDSATDAALLYAYNAGVTILAATGNENSSTISYPAINTYVIGVGAASPCGDRKRSSSLSSECNPGVNTDPHGWTCDGERWWGSNYGSTTKDAAGAVDIIAPTILPTTDIHGSGGYQSGDYEGYFNGTSCATPYAAGVCALIKSKNPGWTPAQVRAQLVNTAQDIVNVESGSGWDRYSGYGMVDAAAAVGGGGGPVPPTAAFSGSPTSGTVPLNVSFTDQSSGSPTSWSWTFGDGGNSTSQNPSHTYNSAGTYSVTLSVSNSAGNDALTKTNYITVNPAGSGYASLPYATGFEGGSLDQYWTTTSSGAGRVLITTANTPHGGSYHMTMDSATNGTYSQNEAWLHLNLAGVSQATLDFWWKDFADENNTEDGVFFSNNGGSSFVKVFSLNATSYTDNSWNNFTLDLDQLAASAGLSLTSSFVVKLQQYDNYAIATDGFAWDDVSVTEDVPPPPPTADFTGTPTSGTAPLAVQFTDASTGATSWSWNFGDGGNSTAQNPSHTYTSEGSYTVTLTATNVSGSDVDTKTGYITVSAPTGWQTITYDDFESGMGSYTDGGADMSRYTGGTYAWQGSAAADIQDNSGTASSFYHTAGHNVTGYSAMEIEFYFVAISMEVNEDFWVQYYNGSSWVTVASFASGADFSNNTFYVVTVPLTSSQVNFPSNAKLRFMCDASNNSDDVYIDAITWRGTGGGAGAAPAAAERVIQPAKRKYDTPLPLADGAEIGSLPPMRLLQNAPNPFRGATRLSFALGEEGHVTLDVFDVGGRRVARIIDGVLDAGEHNVTFDASSLTPGVYFYRLTKEGLVEQKKMVVTR